MKTKRNPIGGAGAIVTAIAAIGLTAVIANTAAKAQQGLQDIAKTSKFYYDEGSKYMVNYSLFDQKEQELRDKLAVKQQELAVLVEGGNV